MGFRSALRGGGLFNGDGTLGKFTFSAIAPGDKKAGQYVYVVLAFLADGKEKVDTQHLFLGGVDQYQFEEGGTEAISLNDKTGEPLEKSKLGGKNTSAARFFETLVTKGEAVNIESVLPDIDAGESLHFDKLEGVRVRLAQDVDVKATKNLGQKVGSDGVSRDRTNTVVEAVYTIPAGKSTSKQTASGKTNGKLKEKLDVDAVREKADSVVIGLIEAATDKKNKTGETPVSKFKMAALRALAQDSDQKAVIAMLGDEAYLADAAERGVFSYDSDAETVSA